MRSLNCARIFWGWAENFSAFVAPFFTRPIISWKLVKVRDVNKMHIVVKLKEPLNSSPDHLTRILSQIWDQIIKTESIGSFLILKENYGKLDNFLHTLLISPHPLVMFLSNRSYFLFVICHIWHLWIFVIVPTIRLVRCFFVKMPSFLNLRRTG